MKTITIAGRRCDLYNDDPELPLVILLKGYGSSRARIARELPMHRMPCRVVVPSCAGGPIERWVGWDAGGGISWQANLLGVDDITFFQRLREELWTGTPHLVVGHSLGGMAAYHWLTSMVSAEIVAVSGGLTYLPSGAPRGDANVLHIHGKRDDIIPATGPVRVGRLPALSIPETLDYWGDQVEYVEHGGGHDVPSFIGVLIEEFIWKWWRA